MVSTYTSSWFSVSDGQTTTHDPESMVSASRPIEILDAQIQWEGIQTSSQDTNYSTNTNTNTVTGDTYETVTDTNGEGTTEGSAIYPSVPSDGLFVENIGYFEVYYSNNEDTQKEYTVTVDWGDGTSDTYNIALQSYESGSVSDTKTIGTNISGDSISVNPDPGYGDITVEASTKYNDPDNQTLSAYTDYPSVPSGYSFNNHSLDAELVNNDSSNADVQGNFDGAGTDESFTETVQNDGYTEYVFGPNEYSNYVGSQVGVNLDNTDFQTIELTVEAQTRGSSTTTNYYDTQNPSVSGDVSASTSITLNDGEQSSWFTLSGLGPNNEDFNHSIDGSGEAKFRFEFDWEYIRPAAVMEFRVVDPSTGDVHKVAVADPTDSSLSYDSVRVGVDGNVYALDVVDPSTTDALDWFTVYHPNDGELSLRSFGTV